MIISLLLLLLLLLLLPLLPLLPLLLLLLLMHRQFCSTLLSLSQPHAPASPSLNLPGTCLQQRVT